jgi:hypothetical protein
MESYNVFDYVPFLHIRTDGGLLVLGISLSFFMGLFDIIL